VYGDHHPQPAQLIRRTFSDPGVNVHRPDVARDAEAGQTDHMPTTGFDISKLSVIERIQLAEDLWDSVAAETGELPLTEAQVAELDRRLAALARDPAAGEPWEVVRGRVERRLNMTG
jgi:putative addiction module component (TIGR02574 family)